MDENEIAPEVVEEAAEAEVSEGEVAAEEPETA